MIRGPAPKVTQHLLVLGRGKTPEKTSTRSLPSKETLRGHSDSSFRGKGYIQCCVGVTGIIDMYSNQELADRWIDNSTGISPALLDPGIFMAIGYCRICKAGITLSKFFHKEYDKIFCQRSVMKETVEISIFVNYRFTNILFKKDMKYLYDLELVVVITEDVQNVHLLLEYRPHIDVSLTCEHDPKLQEYCVCPQNMPQCDSEGIRNQAPETNKPMVLNSPTSINREASDQVSVEAKQLGHLYLSIDRKPSIQVPESRTTEVCRSAIMQEVNVLTIDQWSVF
ncbi:hypothetical protein ANN_10459 [Periplaneta americana]|uniref:Uncharacterized protein n=1 Tax=Periplaneta americana TaxID=6978 RepID=A0ABQ8TRG5_PERAM|nr:hypothetical protein ANN_10459 [Periplaneta americana]